MFSNRSEYDHGVNTFNPEGRLYQVEYAIEAIKLGTTVIGIQTAEGVVLAVEKRAISPLIIANSIEKIMVIDTHLGAAMSGITGDARTLIDHTRVEAQNYRFNYNEPLPVESCAQSVCDLAVRFGEGKRDKKKKEGEIRMSRPFGVALLIAGVDENGPALYLTDPSGTSVKYLAKAIGAGSEGAQAALQEKYNKSMSFEEAEKLALSVLKQVMEEKISSTNVEMAAIKTDKKIFECYTKDRIEAILATF